MRRALALVAVALLASTAWAAIDFYNVATVDTGPNGLGLARPGSVAFNGTDLFVGGAFSGNCVTKIANPLTAPSVALQFGGPTVGNGFVSLDTYGNMVVAATNNGGVNDIVQTFDLLGNPIGAATGGTLLKADSNPMNRIDGAAIDPGWLGGDGSGAGIHVAAYGVGTRQVFDPTTFANLNGGFTTWNSTLGSGNRDVVYDKTNGDLYLRTLNGVGRAQRVGANNFVKFSDGTTGVDAVIALSDGTNSAINVEYLPEFNGAGSTSAVIANFRTGTNPFEIGIQIADVAGTNLFLTANWLNADGTGPFADLGTGVGGTVNDEWYDFSYDPTTKLLAISAYAQEKVYIFSGVAVPEPASLLLLGLAGLLIRRR